MPAQVTAIYISPAATVMPNAVNEVEARTHRGLVGDRYFEGCGTFSDWEPTGPGRELTLIEGEELAELGKPSEEIVADFIEFVPKEVKEVKETATKSGYKHMPGAFSAVWRSLGLAEWDKHVAGKTSEHTDHSIRDMFERQSASGAFVSHGEVEIPHITTDFELSLQAMRTIIAAPGWLAGLKDVKLIAKVESSKKRQMGMPSAFGGWARI